MTAKREEAKPWEPTNSDGTTNYGSYAYQAALGLTELAHEMLFNDGQEVTRGTVKALAATLVKIADDAQAAIRVDKRWDRMDNSHTRARGAVRTTIESMPPPWQQDAQAWADWRSRVLNRSVALLRIAQEIDNNDFGGEPWLALASTPEPVPGETAGEPAPPPPSDPATGSEAAFDAGNDDDAIAEGRIPLDMATEQITEVVQMHFPAERVAAQVSTFVSTLVVTNGTVDGDMLDTLLGTIATFKTADSLAPVTQPAN